MKRILILLVACLCSTTFAGEKSGVEMPDEITIGTKKLVLNGMGNRVFMDFLMKIYVAGLYVEKKSTNAQEILASNEIKHLEMEFKHELVEKKKLIENWENGYKKNCGKSKICDANRDRLRTLLSYMTDMRAKQKMSFTFYPDKVEFKVKGETKPAVEGADFSRIILSIFIGEEPPNKSLKEGLLGLDD